MIMKRKYSEKHSGARVVYVSAKKGDFPAIFSKLYGKKHPSPMTAIAFQSTLDVTVVVLRLIHIILL